MDRDTLYIWLWLFWMVILGVGLSICSAFGSVQLGHRDSPSAVCVRARRGTGQPVKTHRRLALSHLDAFEMLTDHQHG